MKVSHPIIKKVELLSLESGSNKGRFAVYLQQFLKKIGQRQRTG